MNNSYHYAFKIKDLKSTRRFYADILGCNDGRSIEDWIDFDFFGSQTSAHVGQVDNMLDYCGNVDGISVLIPHFGCLLTEKQFEMMRLKLEGADIEFVVNPQARYKGHSSQPLTIFVIDLSGNALKFKSFKDGTKMYCKEGIH